MSYDINLVHPITRETLEVDKRHFIRGGTYCVSGTTECHLNVTYNYGRFFRQVLDSEKGIRTIYGMSGAESLPVLKEAISKLGDDITDNYWDATEGNAKAALYGLLALAQMRPDGIWDGD